MQGETMENDSAMENASMLALWKKIRSRREHMLSSLSHKTIQDICFDSVLVEKNSNDDEGIPMGLVTMRKEEVEQGGKDYLIGRIMHLIDETYDSATDKTLESGFKLGNLDSLQNLFNTIEESWCRKILGKVKTDVKSQHQKPAEKTSDKLSSTSEKQDDVNIAAMLNPPEFSPIPIRKSTQVQEPVISDVQKKIQEAAALKKLDEEFAKYFETFLRTRDGQAKGRISLREYNKANVCSCDHGFQKGDITYQLSDMILHPVHKRDLDSRLDRWDPYWKVISDLSKICIMKTENTGFTTGLQNSKIIQYRKVSGEPDNRFYANGCFYHKFQIPPEFLHDTVEQKAPKWSKKQGDAKHYENSERALILRVLPRKPPRRSYRADTHYWPKGTVAQLNYFPIFLGQHQRKQQPHDKKLWKGMCHTLDLTADCKTEGTNVLELAFYEFEQDNPYGFQLAICEYRDPDTVQKELLEKIESTSYDDALKLAVDYIKGQSVTIDDTDNDCDNLSDLSQVFSLICPISMTPIKIPVRGKECKHIQCFDLNYFLNSNKFVSGSRWKCPTCNVILDPFSLLKCGLFERVIQCREEKSGTHIDKDHFELRSDKTWTLSVAKKEFMKNEIRGSKERAFSTSSIKSNETAQGSTASKARKKVIEEIIID